MKKLISIILAVVMAFGFCTQVFAAEVPISSQSTEQSTETFSIEELGNSVLYTAYNSNTGYSYSSQISTSGYVNISYGSKIQNKIYNSDTVLLSDVVNIDTSVLTMDYLVENCESINNQIMANMDSVDFELAVDLNSPAFQVGTSSPASVDSAQATSLEAELLRLFGPDYTNNLIDYTTRQYDGKTFTLYCREHQDTYEIEDADFYFEVGTAFSVISSWLSLLSGAINPLTALKFVQLIKKSYNIVDDVYELAEAASGTFYAYACDRTQIVTIPSYTSTTLYWAGWSENARLILCDGEWSIEVYYENKHWDYDNTDALMQKGFDNFVAYYYNG